MQNYSPPRYDEFGFYIEEDEPASAAQSAVSDDVRPDEASLEYGVPHTPIRQAFPEAGSVYLGGTCDGWEYRTVFGGTRLANTYAMLRQFLEEEGYSDIPVPDGADALNLFRRQRTPQLQLFPERGYIHNPIKILFHPDRNQRNSLILCLYNEQVPDHLLRFHGVKR
jgi:hypothetical protein